MGSEHPHPHDFGSFPQQPSRRASSAPSSCRGSCSPESCRGQLSLQQETPQSINVESHALWVMPKGSEGTRRRGGISETNWKPTGLSGRGKEGMQLQAIGRYGPMSRRGQALILPDRLSGGSGFLSFPEGKGGERGGETLTSVECSVVFALMFPRAQNRG